MKTEQLLALFANGHESGATVLARFLGITRHAIYQWPEYVPRHWGYEIEARSGGAIKYEPAPGSAVAKVTAIQFSDVVSKNKSTKVQKYK